MTGKRDGIRLRVTPSAMSRETFVATFGEIYEESPWVAEAVWPQARAGALDNGEALYAAMKAAVDGAGKARRLALIRAHPDLAGRAAAAGTLSRASRQEQSGAGLDRLTPDELARFKEFNRRYKERFGFPFVIAVKGKSSRDLLDAFAERLRHEQAEEFDTAIAEIHKIARLRLAALEPR